jgi:hypothetical protein
MRPGRLPRFDPERAAQAASVCVAYWDNLPWLGMYARSALGASAIALHSSLARPDHGVLRRLILAHALAYHYLDAPMKLLPLQCSGRFPPDDAFEAESLRLAGTLLCPPATPQAYCLEERSDVESAVRSLVQRERLPEEFARWWLADLASRGRLKTSG